MGVVTGVIGCLQALEAIKIILSTGSQNPIPLDEMNVMSGKMLIFDALTSRFRTIKLRPRRSEATKVSWKHGHGHIVGEGGRPVFFRTRKFDPPALH